MRTITLLRVIGWIDASPLWFRWLLPFQMTALVGVADLTTNADVAFTLAYLMPIALAAWHLSSSASWLLAGVSTTTSWAIDLQALPVMPHPAIVTINLVGQMLVFGFFGTILSRLRKHLDHEHAMATTDSLTGLANRRAFWIDAEREVQRCRRTGSPYSLAYVDVDSFKSINDKHGHRGGDEVLVAIAKTLLANTRTADCVARIGGDEFALLLPDTEEQGASVVIEKLRAQIESAEWNRRHRVTVSIGRLTVTDTSVDVRAVVAQADKLMYAVKAAGKNGHRHQVIAAPAQLVQPQP